MVGPAAKMGLSFICNRAADLQCGTSRFLLSRNCLAIITRDPQITTAISYSHCILRSPLHDDEWIKGVARASRSSRPHRAMDRAFSLNCLYRPALTTCQTERNSGRVRPAHCRRSPRRTWPISQETLGSGLVQPIAGLLHIAPPWCQTPALLIRLCWKLRLPVSPQ